MYDENNIFAKIIRGEIPCDKVYEDDDVLFFKDINPIAKVHVLGIPKSQCVDFSDFISKNTPTTISEFFTKTNSLKLIDFGLSLSKKHKYSLSTKLIKNIENIF